MNHSERLFPNFKYRSDLSEYKVYDSLKTKWVQRMIMQDGPLGQPDNFFLLNLNEEQRSKLNEKLDDNSINQTLNPMYVGNSHVTSIDNLVRMLMNETLRLPIIYKPNNSALGDGIFFIYQQNDDYLITMIANKGGPYNKSCAPIVAYARDFEGFQQIGNVYQALITENILEELFLYGTMTDSYALDPGLVESVIPSLKLNGQAYETRHTVYGNFSDFTISEVVDNFARIGGSSFFANQTGLYDKSMAGKIRGKELYTPLFDEFIDIKKEEFEIYVHDLLKESFLHYAKKFKNEGFVFNAPSSLQFDLMWLPPNSSNLFPIPALTECTWVYSKPAMLGFPESRLEYVSPKDLL